MTDALIGKFDDWREVSRGFESGGGIARLYYKKTLVARKLDGPNDKGDWVAVSPEVQHRVDAYAVEVKKRWNEKSNKFFAEAKENMEARKAREAAEAIKVFQP